MFYTIVNALLYIFTFHLIWKKKKTVDLGVVLMSVYTLVACVCVLTYSLKIQPFYLSLWPFLYVYLCFILAASPLLFKNFNVEHFQIKRLGICYAFLILMFVAGIVNIYYSLNSTITLVQEDEVLEMYQNKADIETSVDTLDWVCKNLLGYLSIPFSVILFYVMTLTQNRRRVFVLIILFMVVLSSSLLTSAMRVLRYNILHDILCLISGYIIFYNKIPVGNRKRINKVVTVGGLVALAFFVFVSISRHAVAGSAYGGNATHAFIYYLGHSMLVFNYGIVDTISNYANGAFLLGLPQPNLGTHNEGDFPTFVGNVYVDFGFFFTILFCFALGFLYKNIKSIKCVADAYLAAFYFVFLFMGVFSESLGYGIAILQSFLLYLFFKIIFK